MIYIFTVSFDISTKDVIDWLLYFKKEYLRYNADLDEEPVQRSLQGKISAYWYRKGILPATQVSGNAGIDSYLAQHRKKLFEYCEFLYTQKRYINTLQGSAVNKLIVLDLAASLGLHVPHSRLLDACGPELAGEDWIYKTINDGGAIKLAPNQILTVLTQLYEGTGVPQYNLTLFQEKIDKKYELRIFYLNGRFWSMAIFSQNDQKTSLDFRNYNPEKPNRTVPYQLPAEIEVKLEQLMQTLKLNSGSIDMIVSREQKYYFLEVNPVGQFGMVSYPCNYHLEKEIAAYLAYE